MDFETAKVERSDIFPTRVSAIDLEPSATEADGLRRLIESQELAHPGLPPQLDGEWIGPADLHDQSDATWLVSAIEFWANRHSEDDGWMPAELTVTELWPAVRTGQGPEHPSHRHPNSIVSGVYYLDAPAGSGVLRLYDPRPERDLLLNRNRGTTSNGAPVEYQPRTNQLILFPSWLRHSIAPNRADCRRVSLAFNLMPQLAFGVATGRYAPGHSASTPSSEEG